MAVPAFHIAYFIVENNVMPRDNISTDDDMYLLYNILREVIHIASLCGIYLICLSNECQYNCISASSCQLIILYNKCKVNLRQEFSLKY